MYGNCVDDELDDYLANIEDVANGLIVDMEHAELMEPLTEACSDLENGLQIFYTTTNRNSIINRMSVAELKTLISSMNAMTKTIENIISRA